MDSPPAVWSRIRNGIWETGLLLVLPLAFHRGFAEQFSTPKFFLAKCLLITGLAVWAIGLIWRPRTRPRRFPLGLPLLAFSVAALVSCLNSPSPRFSILEVEFALCGPAWVLLLVSWERGESAVRRIAILTASAGALVAAITLLQRWGYDPVLLGGYQVEWGTMVARMRLYSTFGNPNFVGGYLIGAVFPALALGTVARARRAKVIWFGLALVMGIAVLLTGSRGAWLGLVAGLLVASLLLIARSGLSRLRPPVKQASTGMCLWPWPTALLALTLVERLAAQLHGRVYLWRFSWPLFWEHPILGSGWGAYQLLYLDLQAKFLAAHPEDVGFWTNNRLLHNDPLQLLLEAGLAGFAAFLWILWNYAREAKRLLVQSDEPWTRYAMAASAGGVTAILMDSLFNYQFAVPPTFILLFTLLAFPALLREVSMGSADPPATTLVLNLGSWPSIVKAVVSMLILAAAVGLLQHETRWLLSEREYETATVLEDRNDLRSAEEAYRHSIALNVLNGRAHFGLSRVLYQTNHFPEALREVVLGEQTYADLHQEVLRARILDQMNNRVEALAAYRHALWLDPTLTTPQEGIQRLSKEQ